MVTLLHVLSYRFILVQIIVVIGVTVNMWLGSAFLHILDKEIPTRYPTGSIFSAKIDFEKLVDFKN